ncbi:MAG: molybdopterin molybdotransferase MoeA [Elusimicrobia bacterium]|nr:molybdopterin molybdotransferase MoeA [Elusimicrobiota bacterium]
MISFEEALGLVLAEARPMPPEESDPLAALGRVCASTVHACADLPPWDRSLMDGFAVRAREAATASRASPVRLRVVADLPAGRPHEGTVGKGECLRIMTGAPIPRGCDAVVMREDAAEVGGSVLIRGPVAAGRNVQAKGGDLRNGEAVVPAGRLIGADDVGALAAAGIPAVSVFGRPVVAALSIGDELVDAGAVPGPGKIAAGNNAALEARALEAGAVPLRLGVVKDRVEDICSALGNAAGAQVVLTAGGTGDGSHDLMRDALGRLGFEPRFRGVAMKPGKSLVFGRLGKALVFGLPGTPAAAMLCFDVLVRPVLMRMMGRASVLRRTVRAESLSESAKEPGVRRFLRGAVRLEDGRYCFAAGGGEEGVLAALSRANAIAVLREAAGPLKKGDAVEVILLDETV